MNGHLADDEHHPPAPSWLGPTGLLTRYQQAMKDFSAGELSRLYAPTGVHEFGFFAPGHAPRYTGPAAIRRAYTAVWASPSVSLDEIRNDAIHHTVDPSTIVCEWSTEARRRSDNGTFALSGILVLRAQDGLLGHVRDYMDTFGLLHHLGKLGAPPGGSNGTAR